MKKNYRVKIIICSYLFIFVFLPLLKMLSMVEWSDFSSIVTAPTFLESLHNSLVVTSISTCISIVIAFLLAYAINKTNIKHKEILKLLLTLPMLIPSISHGLGIINLFGTNGLISSFFGWNVVGKIGIILGSVLYSYPIAFLIIDDGYKYIDNVMYDNAKVLGLNKWQTFKKVTFCYLKKPLFSSIFAVFTLIFTDYGVPLSVGGKYSTLPVLLYKEVIGLLNFSKGTMIGLFLLFPAIVTFIFDNFTKDYTNNDFKKRAKIESDRLKDILFTLFVYCVLFFVGLIVISFVFYAFVDYNNNEFHVSFKHFSYVLDNDIIKYVVNSLIIAIIASITGTCVAYFSAYITARIEGKMSKIIHLLTLSSLAIPGVVLGLAYTICFKDTILHNTFFILIFVNIVHFMGTPYLMAYNALKKVNSNYDIIAKTCNISFVNTVIDIIIPCTKNTIREMFSYFFTNSMITISAVAFLFSTVTMPMSLLIGNYEGSRMLGEASIVSLTIFVINIIEKGLVYYFNRKNNRSSSNGLVRE